MKCIEDEIPFEVPKGWEWARIFTLAEDLPYGTSKKSTSSGLIAVLRMGNIQSGEIDYADLVYSSDAEDIKKYILKKNDLLFNRTNSAEWVGKTAIYRGNIPAIYAGYLIRIRTFIDSEYLNVVMNSGYAKEYCNSVKTDGVNQSNINAQKLGYFLVPIPPIIEQRRISSSIAKFLLAISTIQKEEDHIAGLIQKAKSKILDLAIRGKLVPQNPDDEPASVLLERIRTEKEDLIKQGKIKRDKKKSDIFKGEDNSYYEKVGHNIFCIDEELPFEIPDNWCWCRLNEISRDIFAGGDKPNICVDTPTQQCSVPVFSNGIDKNGLYGYTEKSRVSEPSITISARGTIGFCCIRTEPFVPIVRLITVIPLSVININYLKIVCDTLTETGEGSSIPQLTVPGIKPKFIPVPPLTEQNKISNKVNEIFSLLDEIEKSLK